ncbi:PepSY domain-containing protein [Sandaracinobacter sp. RS1-74]|uniref:PepSY-associated TM helix domain-containing protein n=1 Tax=Sandaracinobacteroides sayramensis TaxID=2913411 RepID=UPI001EDC035F|nr:PepSY-associated TM helix domain-containing protein [Sandaracinobacteroides sayramensis]MCG2840682.1 PepSY domain-containing protein [Sandaracinobacteroides sayramensis]
MRTWRIIHSWTSLVCTLFLLMLCITGLPLIFQHEIYKAWIDDPPTPLPAAPADMPRLDLDRLVSIAKDRYPDHDVEYVFGIENAEPRLKVALEREADHHDVAIELDARTGEIVFDSVVAARPDKGPNIMNYLVRLHLYMMVPGWGGYFLGFMGILFVVALVSGVILYGPYTRKQDFGDVRDGRGGRIRWLDLHNLLGMATLAWLLVVGVTGALHTLEDLLDEKWEREIRENVIARKAGLPAPPPESFASPGEVIATVRQAIPADREIVSLMYPGHGPVGDHYFFLWTKGSGTLGSRVFAPVIVEATTGEIASAEPFPWYLRALYVMQPLHFGDYGGIPLKIIWAIFDIVAIVVLGSGVYLWIARKRWLANADPVGAQPGLGRP